MGTLQHRLSVLLSRELAVELHKHVDKYRITMSDFIGQAIAAYICQLSGGSKSNDKDALALAARLHDGRGVWAKRRYLRHAKDYDA